MSTTDINPGRLGVRYLIDGSQDSSLGIFELTVPDIGAQYFRDIAAVVNSGGPPDKSALIAVMSRYGLVPAAPK